jgi:hypothetical protein
MRILWICLSIACGVGAIAAVPHALPGEYLYVKNQPTLLFEHLKKKLKRTQVVTAEPVGNTQMV